MKDRSCLTGKFIPTHNLSYSREYGIWGNIVYRCKNSDCKQWNDYGGRGIDICDEWLSFENFISDMGLRPSKNHSVDRIDVNGNYEPGNCRWATKKEQSRNRRNSEYLILNGEKIQLDYFCEKHNLSKHAIRNRIRRGWDMERIVSTPVRAFK